MKTVFRWGMAHGRRFLLLGTDAPELGDKRRQIPPEKARDILKILNDYRDGDTRMTRMISRDGNQEEEVISRIFPTTHFGFRKITVERPLRLNFQATPDVSGGSKRRRGFRL